MKNLKIYYSGDYNWTDFYMFHNRYGPARKWGTDIDFFINGTQYTYLEYLIITSPQPNMP